MDNIRNKHSEITMEILPLLQSRALSNDVILNHIYPHLCRIKSPLTPELKSAIINDHFHLKKILLCYYNDQANFSRKPRDADYFLHWVENDLLLTLNDNRSLLDGLSTKLLIECPGVTKEYLLSYPESGRIQDKIYDLWLIMSCEKKLAMYQRSVDKVIAI
jgi:hypothetical protein